MMLYFWPHLTPFWEYVIHTKPSPYYPTALNKEKEIPYTIWKILTRKPKLLCTEDSKLYVLYISPPPKVYIPYINVRYTVLKGKKNIVNW